MTIAMKTAWMMLVHVVKVSELVFFIVLRATALIPMKIGLSTRKKRAT